MEKHIWFNNLKFTRDEKTGYYLNSTIRERLHRYVWRFYNGEIPDGYEIHHKNGDKGTVDVAQLELKKKGLHQKEHGYRLTQEERRWRRNNMNHNVRPKAIEWHKSAEGREWHSENSKRQWKRKSPKKYICSMCGKEYLSLNSYGEESNTFCSNACKSKWRRQIGKDLIVKVCSHCGKEFETNRFRPSECCSRTCSNRLHPRLPQLRDRKVS